MNLAAHPNKITFHCLHPSITALGPSRKHPPNLRPTPSNQFVSDSATFPSNPRWASTRREPRSFNLGTLSTNRGSRSVDHGPMCLELGPRTRVQGSGFRHDINTSIYGRPGVTPARAEHYAFPKSGNERGNNSERKKAASNLRRLYV